MPLPYMRLSGRSPDSASPRSFFHRCLALALVACALFASGAAQAAIQFGVNGHIGEYPLHTLTAQLDALKDLGATSYRLDVYGTDTGGMNALAAAIREGKARGIAILPVLVLHPIPAETEAQHYRRAYALARAVASRFAADIDVWELGNELDLYSLIRSCEMRDNGVAWPCEWGAPDGSSVLHYYGPRYRQVRALLKGLGAGVAAADPTARRIIDTSGWFHYGFLHRLRDDGVPFEITGYHWYSEQGDMERAGSKATNILRILAEMGKPIWITEFDRRYGSYGTDGLQQQAVYLEATMNQFKGVAATYNIEMAHVYELMDSAWLPPAGAAYGLLSLKSSVTTGWDVDTKKPAYLAFQRAAKPAPVYPDLVVTAVKFAPSPILAGKSVIFSATIKNQGKAASKKSFRVGFYVDGQLRTWATYATTLAAGQSVLLKPTDGQNASRHWTAVSGAHTLEARVDDLNAVAEVSNANNKRAVALTVH